MPRLMTIVAIVATVAIAASAHAADKIVLQLHGPAQFQFAGYYAALWQGFYRDAGLEVEIKPGAPRGEPAVDAVREVTEGRAQFGTGTAELVVRIAQGQPLLLLAPIFQQSGTGVFYRSDASFPSPGSLAKARVGRLPASDILDIELATALRAEGVDPEQFKPVPLQAGETVTALAERSADAAPGSSWEVPWRAHEKGFQVKSFNPADYRVEFYGDTLFTLARFAKVEAAMVRAFRAASLKGWEYALTHADEISTRMLAELPRPAGISDAAGFTRYQAELAVLLARHPTVSLGHSNPERWRNIQAALVGVGATLRTAEPESFIYDPDAELRTRNDLRSVAILGGTLLAGLVLAVLLWRIRGRRPSAVEAAAEAAPPAAVTTGTGSPATVGPPAGASAAPAPTSAMAGSPKTTGPTPAATTAAPLPASPTPPTPAPLIGPIAPAPVPPAPVVPAAATAPPSAPVPPAAGREPTPADLNAVLTDLERAMRREVPRQVAFRLSLLPELWRCRADPPVVRKLVLDLVGGAAGDLKGGGDLVVGTRNFAFDADAVAATPGAQLGEFVRVTVRDSGPGLSDAAFERVFDPAATTRPSAVAAQQAVRGFGGFARVESAEGVGTAVHVYFPRAYDPAAAAKPPDNPAKAAE